MLLTLSHHWRAFLKSEILWRELPIRGDALRWSFCLSKWNEPPGTSFQRENPQLLPPNEKRLSQLPVWNPCFLYFALCTWVIPPSLAGGFMPRFKLLWLHIPQQYFLILILSRSVCLAPGLLRIKRQPWVGFLFCFLLSPENPTDFSHVLLLSIQCWPPSVCLERAF